MPNIDWHRLPGSIRQHLRDRLRAGELTPQDILKLDEWIRSRRGSTLSGLCSSTFMFMSMIFRKISIVPTFPAAATKFQAKSML
jgi:hypothetical protein